MKFFIAKLLLFPLIAVINCQNAPTSAQTQCFTDALSSDPESQEFQEFQLCTMGTNDLSQLSNLDALCSSRCFDLLQNIYTSCGYNGLAQICGGGGAGGGGSGGGFSPTDEDQLQCISDRSSAQALDVVIKCGSTDLSDLSSICNSGACFDLLEGIYSDCGYNVLTQICSGGGGVFGPTDDQLVCISDASTAQAFQVLKDCGTDLSDLSSICNRDTCVDRFQSIYSSCGYSGFSQVCGGGGGGGDGFPNLPEPTDEQLQCIIERSTPRIQEIENTCGDLSMTNNEADAIRAICDNSACMSISREIYDGCNYNVIDTVCGGSVRVYAVPVFVLISALLSMIFS